MYALAFVNGENLFVSHIPENDNQICTKKNLFFYMI